MKELDNKLKRKIGALLVMGMFLAVALAMPVTSDPTDSDWQRASTNTYLGNPGDRVGINDNTPDFKLEVTGSSGKGYFGVTSSIDGDIFIIDSGGDVGIGTTAPGNKLTIQEDSTTPTVFGGDGQLRIQGDTDTNEYLHLRLDTMSNCGEIQVGSSGNPPSLYPLFLNPRGGNVGDGGGSIGTGPVAGLDVHPRATSTDNFKSLRSTMTLALPYALDTMDIWYGVYVETPTIVQGSITTRYALVTEPDAGNVGIGTTSVGSNDRLTIKSAGSTSSYYGLKVKDSGGADQFVVRSDGNVGIGITSPDNKLEILSTTTQLQLTHTDNTNYATFNVNQYGKLTIQTTGDNIYEDIELCTPNFDNAIYIDDDVSNVGIGTTSPDNTLEILSTATQLQLTHTHLTDFATFTVDINGKLTIQNTGNDADIEICTPSFDNAIVIDNGYENIGIGTTSPSNNALLHLRDDSDDVAIAFSRLDDVPDFVMGVDAADNYFKINHGISLATNSDFNIDSSGRVGIGTSTPNAKLHSESMGEDQLRLAYSDNNFATFGVSNLGVLTIQSNCNGFQTEDIIIKTGDFNNAIYIDNGNKGVGIGISPNSGSELHIGGETPQLTIGDGGTEDTSIQFNGNEKDFYIALADIGDTANDLVIGRGSTIGSNLRMVIENGGEVGIATSTPDRKLDILDTSYAQLRLTHTDDTVYTDLQTTSNGELYLNPSHNNVGIEEYNPVATLDVNGGLATHIRKVTENYEIDSGTGPDDYTIVADASEGEITITLPDADTCKGRIIVVKKIGGGDTYNVVIKIKDESGDLIDGVEQQTLGQNWYAHTYQTRGNNRWYIIADKD